MKLLAAAVLASALACAPSHFETTSTHTNALTSDPVSISPTWQGTYARLARLADGSLLGTLTGNADGLNHLRASTSTDNGATFTDVGEIAQSPGDLDNTQTIQLPYTAPGASAPRLLAAYRNHDRTNGQYTFYRITISRSDDGGASWVFHAEVDTSTPPVGIWEPFLFTAPDGTLQIYYAAENAADDQDIVMKASSDGGVTWSQRSTVAGAGITSRDGMPGVTAYTYNGHTVLFAIFESFVGPHASVMSVQSTDNGATWGNRAPVYTPAPDHTAGSPQVTTVGNRVVAVFMNDDDAANVHWPDQAAVKSVTWNPGDPTWSGASVVAPASAYWPGVIAGGDSSALFTYDNLVLNTQIN